MVTGFNVENSFKRDFLLKLFGVKAAVV